MKFFSDSLKQTAQIAADFAASLSGGEVIGLEGDLGSGKTTFVQGVAKALGITDQVTSPTFGIMHVYEVTSHAAINQLVHVDCYRLESKDQLVDLGLEEWCRPDTVMFIEWPMMETDKTIRFGVESGKHLIMGNCL